MKNLIKKIPGANAIFGKKKKGFTNSTDYWKERYKSGGNSGAGSYNQLAEFKGEFLNEFVQKNNVDSVIELGSGDGNQLDYFDFKKYTGFDVSETVVKNCQQKFANKPEYQFNLMKNITNQKADMVMSLDVIYHLIEDEVYHNYMQHLFAMSNKYVAIYAYDSEGEGYYAPHVRPRKFSDWINANATNFRLVEHVPNKYPFDPNDPANTSIADFYLYEK